MIGKLKKIQILESILLEALNNKITITATNLESAIIIDIKGDIVHEGSVLIDKSNFKLIKKLKDSLHIMDVDNTVTIKSNRELKFMKKGVTEYPEIEISKYEYVKAFDIIESEIKNSFKIKGFASSDTVRPALNGLCINNRNITAIDGFKLAQIELNIYNECKKSY